MLFIVFTNFQVSNETTTVIKKGTHSVTPLRAQKKHQ
jgi:hypothetical protein